MPLHISEVWGNPGFAAASGVSTALTKARDPPVTPARAFPSSTYNYLLPLSRDFKQSKSAECGNHGHVYGKSNLYSYFPARTSQTRMDKISISHRRTLLCNTTPPSPSRVLQITPPPPSRQTYRETVTRYADADNA